jgi:hypothetical protein
LDASGKEHDVMHVNVHGAAIAVETKLGTGASTPVADAVLMGTGTGTSGWDTSPTFKGTVTLGVDDTGVDLICYGAATGAYMKWNQATDDLQLVGAAGLDIAGDIDVDGTANLDAVDIDGAVQIDNTVTVGVDDTGHDVTFYGATSGRYLAWDESLDQLVFRNATKAHFHDANGGENIYASADGHLEINAGTTLDMTAPTIDLNASTAVTIGGPVTVGVDDTGHDVKFFGATSGAYLLYDESEDDLLLIGGSLGVGLLVPDDLLHVYKGTAGSVTTHADAQVTIEAPLTAGLQFLSGSGQENRIIFGDRYDNDIGGITYDHDDNSLRFTLNTAERIVVDSGGTVFLDGSLAMNGDTAAANQLDTYEEGTWSPTYISSNGDMASVVVNASFTRGTYVRIGRQVWVNGFIRTDSIGTLGTGYAIISGLPYDSYNVAVYNAYPTHVRTYFAFDADGPDIVTLGNNDNELWLVRDGGAGTTDHGILATDLSTAAARNGIAFQLTYITDAAA